MKYNEKYNFKKVWLIIFLSPIIVAILVSISIVKIPISNDWIGFYGAIIGGLLSGLLTFYSMYFSLSGVREQIGEQKEANNLLKTQLSNDIERHKEEQRLNVRPYINEYAGNDGSVIYCNAHLFEGDNYEYDYADNIIIRLKNIGTGPIISLKILGIRQSYTNDKLNQPVNEEIKSLEVSGIINLHISYMTMSSYLMNTIDIVLQYSDILENYYRQVLTVQVFRDDQGKYKKCRIDSISRQELISKNIEDII